MDLGGLTADPAALLFQVAAALLFGLVFLFLWQQSKVVYFGLWSAAWGVQAAAPPFAYGYMASHSLPWLAAYAFLEFAFALLLFAAGRAGFSGSIRDWRAPLKILFGFPVLLAIVYAWGWHPRQESVQALHAAVLCSVYAYNFASIRTIGVGGRVFRFSLLFLAGVFLYHAAVIGYVLLAHPAAGAWLPVLQHNRFYDFGLHAVLAFAALAMWIESQQFQLGELSAELESARSERNENLDKDYLTGLLNRAALDRRMGATPNFDGIVAVCDIDNFKDINDRYGHLTGDEILRSIGHLVQSSIRQDDLAFRWGGDEFVILFHSRERAFIDQRMQELSGRLHAFRVRGYGALPISFSWGAAEAGGRSLREAIEEADQAMYRQKRNRGKSVPR
jgi:diguanylate cyclase (GGDEF)-like protein